MNTRKIMVSVLCILAIVAASVAGTMAYLTSQSETVVNTFTMGNVDITLDETHVDEYGNPVDAEGNPIEEGEEAVRLPEGNKYKMIPGHTYTKDPTITVAAESEASYVRMLVAVKCYDVLQEMYEGEFLPQYFVEGWDPEVWVSTQVVDVSDDGKVAIYEFRYFETVDGFDAEGNAADEVLPALFTNFTVPGEFDAADLEALEGFEIAVVGHAIQAMGFEAAEDGTKTAEDAAWEAFDAQQEENAPDPII